MVSQNKTDPFAIAMTDESPATARTWQGQSRPEGTAGWRTLRDLILARADDSRPWLRFYSGQRLLAELTFADYTALVSGHAAHYAETLGIGPGVPVLVTLPNSPAMLVACGALLCLGAVIVPVTPEETLAYKAQVAESVGAHLLIGPPGDAVPAGLTLVAIEDVPTAPRAATPPPAPALDDTSPAVVIFTSGTTGLPKGVVQEHGAWLVNTRALVMLHQMGPAHVHMAILPLFHVNAFGFSFLGTLMAGARLVLTRQIHAPSFWKIVRQEDVAVVSVAPPALKLLLDFRRSREPVQPGGLRYVVSAASALSQDLVKRWMDETGVPVYQGYGLSEATNFNLTLPPDLPPEAYGRLMLEADPPSAGCPLWAHTFAILDEAGQPCDAGVVGEICLRSWSVSRGYLHAPEANAELFRDGWLHSGDLGWWEPVGDRQAFFISGRIKETAKVYGQTVSLVEVDRAVAPLSGGAQAVAVAFPNRYAGEEIGLFLVPGEGTSVDPEALLRAVAAELPAFKTPKVAVVGDAVPVTPTGKIRRRSLTPHFALHEERLLAAPLSDRET